MTPGVNPIYAGFERFCPRDSKNVLYVDVGIVQTCLDLIESCRGSLCDYRVSSSALAKSLTITIRQKE